jgi:glutathione S-transferase
MRPVVVHHLEQSRSHRIVWLLEELGMPYSIEHHQRHPKTMRAGRDLRALHPLGKAPVIRLGDEVLAESGAILEHLLDEAGETPLRPAHGTEAHRRFRFFLHYAEGSLMPPLLVKLITGKLRSLPLLMRPLSLPIAAAVDKQFTDPEIALHLAFLESELSERDFLCGDTFTAADIQLSFPLQGARARSGLDEHPALNAYLDRITSRPAYERAIERGGALDLSGF